MLARWPIRYKLLLGVAMLLLIVAILSFSGFRGVYAYRGLTHNIRHRANELPLAAHLSQTVGELRVTFSELRSANTRTGGVFGGGAVEDVQTQRENFREALREVDLALQQYREQLKFSEEIDPRFGGNGREEHTVEEIEALLNDIKGKYLDESWVLQEVNVYQLEQQLEDLHRRSGDLPGHLRDSADEFYREVRGQYRTWIVLTWMSSALAILMLFLLVRYFYVWVFLPLGVLIDGSRRVARGQFNHRLTLKTNDEMAELAGAMNDMTTRFEQIRDDLDEQVRQRTKEVVRGEQLASVGFLAAGVAHEINNPLASIAWCAESLESRLYDILHGGETPQDEETAADCEVLRKYLRRIQDEAFRCKGITERLLDFSRLGDVEKQEANLGELIEGVIEMVKHLGKYRSKKIQFECDEYVVAAVNSQEIKQVVLNLITNALDSVDDGGLVQVRLSKENGAAELLVVDNGCGMSEAVLKHIFEPFFTRRRDGQGTGLGLSITYRIVTDHGGTISAESGGPGCGSRFCVTLPLVQHEEKRQNQFQAA